MKSRRKRCVTKWDMYDCKHEKSHPTRYHEKRLRDMHVANEIHGKTLAQLTIRVETDYENLHVEKGYCVRHITGATSCVHTEAQRPLYIDTIRYIKGMGYIEHYQNVSGKGWQGLWEHPTARNYV